MGQQGRVAGNVIFSYRGLGIPGPADGLGCRRWLHGAGLSGSELNVNDGIGTVWSWLSQEGYGMY